MLFRSSLRALHFDPTAVESDAKQQQGWREWLRQANLFQFLPHMLLSTPGCSGSEISAVDLAVSLADPAGPAAGDASAAPLPSAAWAESLRFAAKHAKDCLELLRDLQPQLDRLGIDPPDFGYELEGPRGEACAELEMAWPAHQVAVVLDDRVDEPPDGWRLFPLHTPAEAVLAALQP